MTHHEWEHVQEATRRVRARWAGTPTVGLVLGHRAGRPGARDRRRRRRSPTPRSPTSRGRRSRATRASSSAAPWPASRSSRWRAGSTSTRATPPSQVTFPIRVMKELGCRLLIVSNAAGGLNPAVREGRPVVIEDHINLMGVNPLIGPNDDRLGPRFPDLIEPYDRALQNLALRVALEENIVAHRGVYVAVTGPNLETRAEYRFLRAIGADVVGMSTVPEVLVAVHAGLKVLGFSIVTDMCLPDALEPVSIEEILAVANEAEGKLRTIVRRVLERLEG